MLQSIMRSVNFLSCEMKLIEDEIEAHLRKNPGIKNNVELMRTIPGKRTSKHVNERTLAFIKRFIKRAGTKGAVFIEK
jgi:hypothetical protein